MLFPTEQAFKMDFIRRVKALKKCFPFAVETEETIKGFPDVLIISKARETSLVECKISKRGYIHFQSTQFAFFRKYAELDIHILAWNALTEQVHYFSAASLLDKKSVYFADGMQNIDLNYAESMNLGVPFDVWLSMLEAVWGA